MDWTRQQKKQLRQALMTVYRSYHDLKIFVAEDLGEQLSVIVQPTGLKAAAFELIEWAEAKGRLSETYQKFCQENSDNAVIQELMKMVGEVSGSVSSASSSINSICPQFEFETVKVDDQGTVIERIQKTAEYWDLDLGGGVVLTLVKIPAGQFWMGSPLDEEERELPRRFSGYENYEEGPRRLVQVPEFWIGKYPVTQMQWQRVASLPKVQRILDSNPSHFQGSKRPVERVGWDDAQEFCRRVSRITGDESVTLPSETQWEYACRAESNTPFAFGSTLSSEIANYNANDIYGSGVKGKSRGQTSPVGQFPANSWGLYDMHGNVCEWCEDSWFSSYDGAPSNGTARRISTLTNFMLVRGGAWFFGPGQCRSAYRRFYSRGPGSDCIGFRIACSAPLAC